MDIIDSKDGQTKLYEQTVEVDEIGADRQPTGKKIPKSVLPIDTTPYFDREAWLAKRLNELEIEEVDEFGADGITPTGNKLKAKKVTVVRGSHDDVIGVQVEY